MFVYATLSTSASVALSVVDRGLNYVTFVLFFCTAAVFYSLRLTHTRHLFDTKPSEKWRRTKKNSPAVMQGRPKLTQPSARRYVRAGSW